MRLRGLAAVVAAGLFLYACASPRGEAPHPRPTPAPSSAKPDARPSPAPTESALDILGPAALPGWGEADHSAALSAWQAGCGLDRTGAGQRACQAARRLGRASDAEARRYFEENFQVEALPGKGVLTAYFSPEYEARDRPDREFDMPVRPQPDDLRPGAPYATRAEIEARPPNAALAWMRAEDLFFLQVQGSGTLTFPDGRRRKAVFAAHNARPFAGIANPMRDRGLLPANNTSGEAIRQWLADHRGPEAEAIMRLNPRYVFFTLEPDDGVEPVGAAGVPLPSGHAIAIDPRHHAYGELIWIVGEAPILAGAFPAYRRMVVALDTGGAILGEVRADLYLGRGDAAGREAGRVRHDLTMYRLTPREP